MRISHVVKTAEEVKAEMKEANASKAEIAAKLDEMEANRLKVEQEYAKTASRFDPSLMKQNQ